MKLIKVDGYQMILLEQTIKTDVASGTLSSFSQETTNHGL